LILLFLFSFCRLIFGTRFLAKRHGTTLS
jgi:hypothetical protein